ncbi:hypothetical protein EP073_12260 [Geovibrio thiophilus]|uniref:Uncharacterized protein n=1 Tax=Geovibrio thiophilus TaxID=139438 RepID=A0A3R6AZJ2_9BACT|nr:hypothetical protein [Geovibrio thiophilus]QAR34149.1 hypothetical protein EP073_12260 [Geovibrio thiophilus]
MKLIKADFCPADFRWKDKEADNPFPPAVAEIKGKAYRLSGFGRDAEQFFHAGALSLNEAFNLSLSIHGEPDLIDTGRMIILAESFGGSKEVKALSSRVKGAKNAESLKTLCRAPEAFLEYIRSKEPSMKTVGMYASLPESHRQFLHSYACSQPSVSAFRNAAETLTDYADREIDPSDMSLVKKLETERISRRTDFGAEFRELASELCAGVSSVSGFETPEITVSFTASSAEEYMEKCEKLFENRVKVFGLFRFLKENDIY